MKKRKHNVSLQTNTYYVYRINGLVTLDITKIKDSEIFFYMGGSEHNNFDKFYVFCLKTGTSTKVLEIHHYEVGGKVENENFVINRLIELKSKIN